MHMNQDPRHTRTIDVRTEPEGSTREAVRKLAELIRGIRIAMMTTADAMGHMHSRPMKTIQSELEDELWFYTDARAHKIDDLTDRHQVNLVYVDGKAQRYVSVSGIAHLVQDEGLLRRFWTPDAATWFPDGPDRDPHLAMIRVQIEETDYWDVALGAMVRIEGFAETDERPLPPPSGPKITIESPTEG
jgi:general stress protein 26